MAFSQDFDGRGLLYGLVTCPEGNTTAHVVSWAGQMSENEIEIENRASCTLTTQEITEFQKLPLDKWRDVHYRLQHLSRNHPSRIE